jgi:peptidoglycan/xylan/chitin deacetylase (PgdA/CDA1 family)/predicted small secreted protein
MLRPMHSTLASLSRRLLVLVFALGAFLLAGCAGARGAGGPVPAGGVPVLAWHFFKDDPGPGDGPLTESFAGFEETVRFLAEHGFRSVFPEEVRAGGGRQVVLTFDDGRREQLRAAEVLERHGFRGIFFVIPGRTRPGSERFLGPEEVTRLASAGHRVAAHGWDHRSLPSSGTEVAASLVRSPRALGRRPAVLDFAFPFGHYTPEVAEALAGTYRHLHTVNPGYWDAQSPLLPRMLVMRGVDPALYREYLLGGAGWAPLLEPLTPDGAVAERVAFRAHGPVPGGVELFSVSADASGRSYVSHPLGESLRVRGDTVWVDLAAHMRRHYPPERSALSYALVVREAGGLRYLSPGLLHWLRDPLAPPPAPRPVRPDTTSAMPPS